MVAHLPETLSAETLAQYRSKLFDIVAAIPRPISGAIRSIRREERRVPGGPDSADVRVLVYAPAGRSDPLLPAILHIYGGGFVSGNADMSDPNSRAYAVDMNCRVVSVDYHLAPVRK